MKYYVEHLGVTITRTSDRTYTHCIVSVSSVAKGQTVGLSDASLPMYDHNRPTWAP